MSRVYQEFSKRKNKNLWKIEIRVGGVRGERIRRGDFETKREAQAALASLQQKERADLFGMRLFGPGVELSDLLAKRADDPLCVTPGRKQALVYFEDFVLFAGRSTQIRDISAAMMREYRDRLIRRGFKNSTIQMRMVCVGSALNASRTYFDEMDTFRAPSLPGLKLDSREKFVPRADLKAVIERLRAGGKYRAKYDQSADVLELLQMTGARIQEILSIEKSQINFDQRMLVIHGTKTKTKRTIPITDSMAEILRRRTTFPPYHTAHFQVRQIATELGIEFSREGWDFHDIRHTAASVLAERGVSHSIIAAILGHSLGGMTARYTHATQPAIREAILKLENYWIGDDRSRRMYVVA